MKVFVGDGEVDSVPADDRGLAYGDGVFETMRAHRGEVPWWGAHWARLAEGAARLGLPLPAQARVRDEARRLLDGGDAVLKLLVTRGGGARGYAPPRAPVPTWALSVHALPPPPPGDGLHVRWCTLRLARQPALAGIKHCNRLEQVLARAECDGFDEGLLLDARGDVAGATAANVCVLRDGRWRTPPVDQCGVAGVCRGWLLREAGAVEAQLSREDVEAADAVVLCNAVRGILPVARLQDRAWAPHPAVAALRDALGAAHPAFAPGVP